MKNTSLTSGDSLSYQNVELISTERSGLENAKAWLLRFDSPAMGGARREVRLLLPAEFQTQKSLPMAVFLPDRAGASWFSGLCALAARFWREGTIAPMALLVPCPDGDGDAALAAGTGLHYEGANGERWIVDDTLECAREALPCLDERSVAFLAGEGAGGYAALRLGAKYTDHFRAICALAPIAGFLQALDRLGASPRAPLADPEGLDVIYWMRERRAILPPIRMECPEAAPEAPGARRLSAEMEGLGIPHIYKELPGELTAARREEWICETLKFFTLHIAPPGRVTSGQTA